MKAKRYWFMAVLAAAIAVPVCWSDDFYEAQRRTLAGLQGVYYMVQGPGREAETYGLTRDRLRAEIKSLFIQNGIKKLTQKEYLGTKGRPYLFINVAPRIEEERRIARVDISVEFRQDVRLVRDPNILFPRATTWYRRKTHHTDLMFIRNTYASVNKSVTEFIDDYLAANPKEHSADEKAPGRIEAKVGQDFVIALPSNPSTGYSWRLARPLHSMLKLQRKRYIPPKVQKIGAGGTEELTFKSVRSGKATIMFEYIRPWEKDLLPARERIFFVVAK